MDKSITNAESHTRANIDSDHYPLVINTRIKLKATPKGGKPRPVYKKCDDRQNSDLNYEPCSTIHEETQ